MKKLLTRGKGQALLMVTLALFAMCGLLGLAVDLGWMYFVQKSAQASADTAALGAVQQALTGSLPSGVFACGSTMVCQAPTACPSSPTTSPSNTFQAACAYAAQNGFTTGGNVGRQNVNVEAGVPPPVAAPGVVSYYWVRVRVAESVPQLFSAILGNRTGIVAAVATGAVVDTVVKASLTLLNRKNDPTPGGKGVPPTGVNLTMGGGPTVSVPGGIMMASQCAGSNCSGDYAGEIQGGGSVTAPFTNIRGTGDVTLGGSASWTAPL